ncbi:NADPH-dependent F420 reductase [Lonepinella sp. BR2919]|uniref:NADPH-dependent F420 reductase n=1 Tax=unclassified Lonepinella TaxID=2642006 RepID=UPI003F6E0FBD
MAKISIFGEKGMIGSQITALFERCGNDVETIGRDYDGHELGDIIVLAVKFPDLAPLVETHGKHFVGKIVIDITNPISFGNLDELLVPQGTSSAEILAEKLPQSQVVKGFNINFSNSVANAQVKGNPASFIFASDSSEAKQAIFTALEKSGAKLVDAGNLQKARLLESAGLLLINLAVSGQIQRDGGLVIV